jgi:hypothetical protein
VAGDHPPRPERIGRLSPPILRPPAPPDRSDDRLIGHIEAGQRPDDESAGHSRTVDLSVPVRLWRRLGAWRHAIAVYFGVGDDPDTPPRRLGGRGR